MGTILAIISTHAPAGGATRVLFALYAFNYNFYSRPCGRGDVGAPLEYASSVAISTHAPAGGATFSVKLPRVILFISPHAPAGGATHAPFPKLLR